MKVAVPPAERRLRAVPPPDDAAHPATSADQAVSPGPPSPGPPSPGPSTPPVSVQRAVARVMEEAIAAGRVLHIDYVDRHGALSRRAIEPVGFVPHRDQWFLLAWCRSRGAARTFRLDRVVRAVATGETATVDEPAECLALSLDIPEASLVRLTLP